MTCPVCQSINDPGRRYCADCGAGMASQCPACGFVNETVVRFCGGCGVRQSTVSPSTPRRVDELVRLPSALEGERKLVTVLFADIKGSLELVANRDPEEARHLLDTVLRHLIRAVRQYEGTVNQVTGDGIMALFGAPLAHEDHALRACLAALRIHELIRTSADELRARFGVEVAVRVGINSGGVVVRTLASDVHYDYTAVGQTTHLASRMENLAAPGTTLITRDTLRLVQGIVSVRPRGALPVKGLIDLVDTYELVGAVTPAQRRPTAPPTRFVGRKPEIVRMREVIHAAADGRGQVIGIVGEAGVGKSRLVREFVSGEVPVTACVLRGHALSYGRAIPYAPIVELLRAHFAAADDDDMPTLRRKVAEAVTGLDSGLAWAVTPLLALLDAAADAEWQALDPTERWRRGTSALRHLLVRESQRRLVCLVVEDLHWVDVETQELLDDLVDLPALKVLLLATFRPEYQPKWVGVPHSCVLRLDPLPRLEANALLDDLLGFHPSLEDVKRLVLERTQGNPFFVEETVAHLSDTGVIGGQPGAALLLRSVETTQVPVTVQGVLGGRIDRLPVDEKWLVQCAAVIGRDVPVWLLETASKLPREALRQALADLTAADLLVTHPALPATYRFKHALTHEVAYDLILRERRRALHAVLLEALEAPSPDRAPESPETLAHHARHGERWDAAARYCRQAGARALAQAANRAAVTWFEHALEAARHLPPSADTMALAIDVRLELRYALSPLGNFEQMMTYLQDAERLAVELGDRRRLGLISAFMGNYFQLSGRPNRAIRYATRALKIGREIGDRAVEILGNAFLASASYARGQYGAAITAAEANISLVGGDLVRERFSLPLFPAVFSRTILVSALAERGEFARALAISDDAIRIAATLDHPYSLAYAQLGLGVARLRQGDFGAAVAVLEAALASCRSANLPAVSTLVAANLIMSYASARAVDRAVALVDLTIEQATLHGDPLVFWLRSVGRAEVLLRLTRYEEALPLARQGVELMQLTRNEGHEGWARLLLADILAVFDRSEATSTYRSTIDLADRLGMRPLLARARLALAELLLQDGYHEEGRTELAMALALGRGLPIAALAERASRGLAAASGATGSRVASPSIHGTVAGPLELPGEER